MQVEDQATKQSFLHAVIEMRNTSLEISLLVKYRFEMIINLFEICLDNYGEVQKNIKNSGKVYGIEDFSALKDSILDEIVRFNFQNHEFLNRMTNTISNKLFKLILPKKRNKGTKRFIRDWTVVETTISEIIKRLNSDDRTMLELTRKSHEEFLELTKQCNIQTIKISDAFDILLKESPFSSTFDSFPKFDPEATKTFKDRFISIDQSVYGAQAIQRTYGTQTAPLKMSDFESKLFNVLEDDVKPSKPVRKDSDLGLALITEISELSSDDECITSDIYYLSNSYPKTEMMKEEEIKVMQKQKETTSVNWGAPHVSSTIDNHITLEKILNLPQRKENQELVMEIENLEKVRKELTKSIAMLESEKKQQTVTTQLSLETLTLKKRRSKKTKREKSKEKMVIQEIKQIEEIPVKRAKLIKKVNPETVILF